METGQGVARRSGAVWGGEQAMPNWVKAQRGGRLIVVSGQTVFFGDPQTSRRSDSRMGAISQSSTTSSQIERAGFIQKTVHSSECRVGQEPASDRLRTDLRPTIWAKSGAKVAASARQEMIGRRQFGRIRPG